MQLVIASALENVECSGSTPYYIMLDGEEDYRCFDRCYYPYQYLAENNTCLKSCDTGTYKLDGGVLKCVQKCEGNYTISDDESSEKMCGVGECTN